MPRTLHSAAIAVALCASNAGCSTKSDSPAPGPIDASGTAADSICANEPRADRYRAGLEKAGAAGRFKVKLLDVTPNPVAHGDNRWNVALADSTGTPVGGATIGLAPFLADRNVGPSEPPVVAADPLPGQYTISKIEIPIAGVWTFTFHVAAKGATDDVAFTFCVPE